MIELSAQRIMVRDGGIVRAFDPAELAGELRRAAASLGIQDGWLADEVARIVEEQLLRERQGKRDPVPVQTVRELAAGILTEAGYADVASVFLRSAGVDPRAALSGPRHPWNRERVADIVRRVLPVGDAELGQVTDRVCEALNALGIREAGDLLIRELALHIGADASPSPESGGERAAGARPARRTCLLDVGEIMRRMPASVRDAIADGAVRALPVWDALPRAAAALDLRVAARNAADNGVLTELAFYPSLAAEVAGARRFLTWLEEFIRSDCGRSTIGAPCLDVIGCDEVISVWFGGRTAAGRRRFQNEMESIIAAELNGSGVMFRWE